jgi:hypothetical protein
MRMFPVVGFHSLKIVFQWMARPTSPGGPLTGGHSQVNGACPGGALCFFLIQIGKCRSIYAARVSR